MCGIAGEIDFSDMEKTGTDYFRAMEESMVHRGPDAGGMISDGCATLVHRRLAVVDLDGGSQPMKKTVSGCDYFLVYNGELYNCGELRGELSALGYEFQGHSDTELVILSFIQWGEGCLSRMNGIFSFAIWKSGEEKLFFARDRVGVKPFFYALEENSFLFASEVKTLLAHPKIQPTVSRKSLAEMILLSPARKMGETAFTQILELKPAHCGWFSRDGFSVKPYWALVDKGYSLNLEETLAEVRRLVVDSIRRQVVCDVPICSFLSGGLDSSLITAIAAEVSLEKGEKLQTFSVDYRDNQKNFTPSHFQPSRDDYYIELVSKHCQTEHHRVELDTAELVDALFSAVEARDFAGMADVDSSLWLFCKEVRKNATVALSGECADEIFGGYPWYRDENIRSQYGFPWAQNTKYRQSFLGRDLAESLQGADFLSECYEESINSADKGVFSTPLEGRMKEMTQLNWDWFMQTLLERKDRMSMAHGLEVRVPFCDYRIAELLYGMPWEIKEFQGAEKGILREAMKGFLPEEVGQRKKSPYPKTYNPDYMAAVSGLLRDILVDNGSPIHEFLDKTALKSLLLEEQSQPWYGQLMTAPQTIAYFIQLNHWLKKIKLV